VAPVLGAGVTMDQDTHPALGQAAGAPGSSTQDQQQVHTTAAAGLNGHPPAADQLLGVVHEPPQVQGVLSRRVPTAGLGEEDEEEGGGTGGMSALIGSLPSAEDAMQEAGRGPSGAAAGSAEAEGGADTGAASSSRSTPGRGEAPADSSSSGGSSGLDRMR
jgi:hypothetical protein